MKPNEKPYYVFDLHELDGLSSVEVKKALTGKVMTCAKCCGERVTISRNKFHMPLMWGDVEVEEYFTVACGGGVAPRSPACQHNISAPTLAQAINDWNAEIDKELANGDPLDYATEIVVY